MSQRRNRVGMRCIRGQLVPFKKGGGKLGRKKVLRENRF